MDCLQCQEGYALLKWRMCDDESHTITNYLLLRMFMLVLAQPLSKEALVAGTALKSWCLAY